MKSIFNIRRYRRAVAMDGILEFFWSRRALSVISRGSMALTVALLVGLSPGLVQAGSETLTNLFSSIDSAMSFRFQEHSWVTPDGRNHVAFNDGTGLSIFTETGSSLFTKTLPLDEGNSADSTADGFSSGMLTLVWSTADYGINYGVFSWDGTQWVTAQQVLPVPKAQGCRLARRPTVANDSLDRLWVAYTCYDSSLSNGKLLLNVSADGGITWIPVNFGMNVAGIANVVNGKIVHAGSYVSLVYTYVAQRATGPVFIRGVAQHIDSNPLDTWNNSTLQRYPYTGSGVDPYGHHFSVTGTLAGTTHLLAGNAAGALLYFRDIGEGFEAPRQLMNSSSKSTYMKVSQSTSGATYVVANYYTSPIVFKSTDNGASFAAVTLLTHSNDPILNYNQPRLEAPSHVRNSLPIWQLVGFANTNPAQYGELEYYITLP